MAETRAHFSREVWIYGALAFAVGVAATMIVVAFLSRGAIRTGAADPLPKLVVVAASGDETAAAWVASLVEAGTDVSAVDPDNYQSGDHVLVLGSLDETSDVIRTEVQRRVREGGGILIVGTIPAALEDLLSAGTHGREGEKDALTVAELPSPILARVRPEFSLSLASLPVALAERPTMSIDARWSNSPDAAVAHWRSGRARVVWCGAGISESDLKDVAMLAVMLRASVRWLAGQPVSDGAAGDLRELGSFADEARRRAQDQGLGFSADEVDDDEIEVTVLNRGEEPIANATVRVWLPPHYGRVTLDTPLLGGRGISLRPVEGAGAVDVQFGVLAPGDRRRCIIERLDDAAR